MKTDLLSTGTKPLVHALLIPVSSDVHDLVVYSYLGRPWHGVVYSYLVWYDKHVITCQIQWCMSVI